MHTLILGGVRSGKSRLAERLARESGLAVTYIATANASDEEMVARIAAHRERRPPDWRLVEEPLALADSLRREAADGRCVLVECLTLWLSNLLWADDEALLTRELAALPELLPDLPGRLIFVGNETNLGVIPMNALARRYCDLAGVLHQQLAARCQAVYFTAAGLPLALKGPPLQGDSQ
ncbi:MAG: bifunctional adenosylcobinamide kinase/adenosylcobinamide-phosphate guanylyltransferase [Gammaproteobacteria bacterium]|jgi:adenosylcobinamide kinase/adenosylcobinamide-phosphate guanylyltransferase|nr:bifunctional adenosylcobinamide kinase/adenosylcobinamide-phosphate guanylyltransferase [Gammaproteobacteria bacterium]